MLAWLGTLWGKVAAGALAVVTVVGAVLLYLGRVRREAREQERARIEAAELRREIEDRRIADDVEADVAGLSDDERRRRLRERWGRGADGGV